MKINEIRLSSVIGDPAAAAIKSLGTGMGTRAQMTQDIFIKDFVGDALSSISNAVRSGLVDRTAATPAQWAAASSPTPKFNTTNFTSPTPPAPTPPKPTPPAPTPPKPERKPPTPPAPTPPAPTPPEPERKPPTPEELKRQEAENKMMKLTKGRGLTRNADGQLTTTIQNDDGTYTQLFYDEDYNLLSKKNRPDIVDPTESTTYDRLNAIFESIIESNITIPAPKGNTNNFANPTPITRNGPTTAPKRQVTRTAKSTIAQYLEQWFNQYMEGVNWKSHLHQVRDQLMKIENSYGDKKGAMREIEKLAQMGYALSKGAAKGAQDAVGLQRGQGGLSGASGFTAGNVQSGPTSTP